ncbi:hypothetical protein BT96DRAFT_948964 [Gymnopus androsaceus JB14]|uniref:NB-ARC domain-containing protein n=1 Tax=Gymnopus androsaceus JB14 TaxID=1447944 RepID=A0A6A4GLT9_9AGAR|nr:hypothetical protein BT96DRAFT_948964 [Gymnopus androsaceus JB14]
MTEPRRTNRFLKASAGPFNRSGSSFSKSLTKHDPDTNNLKSGSVVGVSQVQATRDNNGNSSQIVPQLQGQKGAGSSSDAFHAQLSGMEMVSSSQLFAHASNFEINRSTFIAANNVSIQAHSPHQIFFAPKVAPAQCIVTLVASGGTGKTTNCFKFISDNSSRFSNIWFFDATSDAMLTSDFKTLGKAAGVGEQVKDVRDFLARTCRNWMCIFDNADDEQLYLKEYIPSCTHGNIIITSRLATTSQMESPGCHIDFGDLNKEDALELLLKHAHEESSKINKNLASKIVGSLEYQALAGVNSWGIYSCQQNLYS